MLPFIKCNLQLDMSVLFADLDNLAWTRHGHNMPSCILPDKYSSELRKIFRLPANSYIMIHNLMPTHSMRYEEIPYLTRWHIDTHRKSAILIPVSLDNDNHYTEFNFKGTILKAPYSRGVPLLFDVKVLHKVSNNDQILSRNVISIGLPSTSYSDLVSTERENALIDTTEFHHNLFSPYILPNNV